VVSWALVQNAVEGTHLDGGYKAGIFDVQPAKNAGDERGNERTGMTAGRKAGVLVLYWDAYVPVAPGRGDGREVGGAREGGDDALERMGRPALDDAKDLLRSARSASSTHNFHAEP
jgi:hypothetical protein